MIVLYTCINRRVVTVKCYLAQKIYEAELFYDIFFFLFFLFVLVLCCVVLYCFSSYALSSSPLFFVYDTKYSWNMFFAAAVAVAVAVANVGLPPTSSIHLHFVCCRCLFTSVVLYPSLSLWFFFSFTRYSLITNTNHLLYVHRKIVIFVVVLVVVLARSGGIKTYTASRSSSLFLLFPVFFLPLFHTDESTSQMECINILLLLYDFSIDEL